MFLRYPHLSLIFPRQLTEKPFENTDEPFSDTPAMENSLVPPLPVAEYTGSPLQSPRTECSSSLCLDCSWFSEWALFPPVPSMPCACHLICHFSHLCKLESSLVGALLRYRIAAFPNHCSSLSLFPPPRYRQK